LFGPDEPERGAVRRSAVAVRHVAFEDLGLLEPILAQHGFSTSYIEASTHADTWGDAKDADLLVVLGGPIGVADTGDFAFLREEVALLRGRLNRDQPTLGVCLGAQLLAVASGGSVTPGSTAEIGYAPVTLTEAAHGSVLEPLAGVAVLHWHGDVISTPPELPPLAFTSTCANQAFARGTNILGLQFHLEADSVALEGWLVGHSYELASRAISVAGLRQDAAAYGTALEFTAERVFSNWLSQLTFANS
jgi:GMP synthase (glutamine-hydrolysing)